MDYWLINSFCAFLLCVLFAGILIPQILLVAFRRNLFDEPDPRKIHKGAVPRLGGIAFTPVVCFSVALLLGINSLLGFAGVEESLIIDSTSITFGFCSLFTLYLVGMADDLVGVRYRAKFVVQIFCAVLLIAGGLWLHGLCGVLFIDNLVWWIGIPLTIIVIVYVVNSINLIDGIDGLASGLSSAALIIYGIGFFMYGQYLFAMISFATLGVLVPFFYYNVFGDVNKRKKIFMGDTGSLTIGLILSFLSLELYNMASLGCVVYGTNAFILAFSPLLIPCLDVVRVFLHRIRRHRNPFLPDKTHIHHKLLALGLKPRVCMVTIVLIALAISVISIVLSRYIEVNILLIIIIGFWTGVNVWLSNRIAKKGGDAKK